MCHLKVILPKPSPCDKHNVLFFKGWNPKRALLAQQITCPWSENVRPWHLNFGQSCLWWRLSLCQWSCRWWHHECHSLRTAWLNLWWQSAGAAVAKTALEVVRDDNSGQCWQSISFEKRCKSWWISMSFYLVRGKWLLNAVVNNDTEDSSTAWDLCLASKKMDCPFKPTHGNIIRFAPPACDDWNLTAWVWTSSPKQVAKFEADRMYDGFNGSVCHLSPFIISRFFYGLKLLSCHSTLTRLIWLEL